MDSRKANSLIFVEQSARLICIQKLDKGSDLRIYNVIWKNRFAEKIAVKHNITIDNEQKETN